jgi:hypothetical protein
VSTTVAVTQDDKEEDKMAVEASNGDIVSSIMEPTN